MSISIRALCPEDAANLHEMFSHADTFLETLQLPYPSLKRWQERLAGEHAGMHMLGAWIDGALVGQLTLEVNSRARRRHSASFGIAVHHQQRGKGVGRALMAELINLCDNWLNVERIELTVFADNQPAIGLYAAFGFEREGIARRFAVRNGELVDALYMARLKPERIRASDETLSG